MAKSSFLRFAVEINKMKVLVYKHQRWWRTKGWNTNPMTKSPVLWVSMKINDEGGILWKSTRSVEASLGPHVPSSQYVVLTHPWYHNWSVTILILTTCHYFDSCAEQSFPTLDIKVACPLKTITEKKNNQDHSWKKAIVGSYGDDHYLNSDGIDALMILSLAYYMANEKL